MMMLRTLENFLVVKKKTWWKIFWIERFVTVVFCNTANWLDCARPIRPINWMWDHVKTREAGNAYLTANVPNTLSTPGPRHELSSMYNSKRQYKPTSAARYRLLIIQSVWVSIATGEKGFTCWRVYVSCVVDHQMDQSRVMRAFSIDSTVRS